MWTSRSTRSAPNFQPSLPATAARAEIYFDAPGGTQACRRAIARMAEHLQRGTANSGGAFASSVETDALSADAHAAMADLLGGEAGEIAFGPNMTSLTLAVSRSLARDWQAGDEIVLSRLDHDANVTPWVLAAEDRAPPSAGWISIRKRGGCGSTPCPDCSGRGPGWSRSAARATRSAR